MPSSSIPPDRHSDIQALKWFVLCVTLAPLVCCGGCLGLAALLSWTGRPMPTVNSNQPSTARPIPAR